VINVLSFWEPLRQLVKSAVTAGFIQPQNADLILFVDGPDDKSQHENYDWGAAVIHILDETHITEKQGGLYDWTKKREGNQSALDAV
jgi:predicted Rossmann-fold nucleotide-binding protein